MSDVLNRAAVGCLNGKEASEVLQAYLNTGPEMAFSVHPGIQQQPQGTGAGDKLIKPI